MTEPNEKVDLRFRGARSEQQEHLETWEENSKQAAQHSKQEAQLGTCPLCGAAVKRRSDGYYECMSCQQAFSPERAATLPPFEAQPAAGLEVFLDGVMMAFVTIGRDMTVPSDQRNFATEWRDKVAEFTRERSRPAATQAADILNRLVKALTETNRTTAGCVLCVMTSYNGGKLQHSPDCELAKAEAFLSEETDPEKCPHCNGYHRGGCDKAPVSGEATRPPEFTVGAAGSDLLGEDTGISITYHHRIEPRTGELLSDAPQSGFAVECLAVAEDVMREVCPIESWTCEQDRRDQWAKRKDKIAGVVARHARAPQSGPSPSRERPPQEQPLYYIHNADDTFSVAEPQPSHISHTSHTYKKAAASPDRQMRELIESARDVLDWLPIGSEGSSLQQRTARLAKILMQFEAEAGREAARGGKTIIVPKPPGFYIAWKPKGTIGWPQTFKTREAAEHFLSTFAPEVREKLHVVEAGGGTEEK